MAKSRPYHCVVCLRSETNCYNGRLWFEGQDIPECDHHDHPIMMVAVHGGDDDGQASMHMERGEDGGGGR